MADLNANIVMRLKDQVSAQMGRIQGNLKNFTSSFKQNWLAVTAAITGAIMAINKAWRIAEMGAKAEQIESSFRLMAESVGASSEKMRSAIQAASAETTNFSNVASKASALLASGLSMDQVTALMQQARAEAKIFGETTEQAFDKIAGAVTGKLMVTLKRNYGLALDLAPAYEAYANSVGKAASELSSFEQTQAVVNAILEKGKAHLDAVDMSMLSNYEKMQMLQANWTTFLETMGQYFLKAVTMIQGAFEAATGSILRGLAWVLNDLAKIPILSQKIKDSMTNLAAGFNAEADTMFKKTLDNFDLVFAKTQEGSKAAAAIYSNAMQGASNAVTTTIKQDISKTSQAYDGFSKSLASSWNSLISQMSSSMGGSGGGFWQSFLMNFGSNLLGGIGNSIGQSFSGVVKDLGIQTSLGQSIGRNTSSALGPAFQLGTTYVGRTGAAVLHKGEAVVPANKVNAGGGQGNVIINLAVQAWDFQDVWRNRKALMSVVAEGIKQNNGLRGVIKSHG